MHWIIKNGEGKPIDPEQFKKDWENLNISKGVLFEQDGFNPITAVRVYIYETRKEDLIRQNITEAIPILIGYGYKVEEIE
ncbi:MAG: hypothetical protein CEO40_150 [Parcubacteria group bacterium LiPW_72]|nr:MAG: hypothetical protein CEO40_150 [Parcubacteria group bacterium LiPW_72]